MKIITINLPERYLSAIQILNDLDIYPSRSEAIRKALHNFLSDELNFLNQDLDEDNFERLIKNNYKKE
jgi:Arc/MetJ-type ribon-helix-helix transcriptional regulator